MKSAYELAMERLDKQSPSRTLSQETKERLADTDSLFRSKIAQRKIFLDEQLKKVRGTPEESAILKQISLEVARLEEECEEQKNRIRKDAQP